MPFEPEIRRVTDANRHVLESLGCVVEEAEPDFAGVGDAFPTLRHLSYHASYSAMAKQRPEWIKDTIHWEIAEAERQTAAEVGVGLGASGPAVCAGRRVLRRYDYFVLPVTQVEPFDVTISVSDVGGGRANADVHRLDAELLVRHPHGESGDLGAGGVHGSQLPVGLQIVGRHRDDWSVLQLAHAFEQATRHGLRRPPVARG